jgi:hypothetical protein
MEESLVQLSMAAPEARIEGLRQLIASMSMEEPEIGQVFEGHPLLDRLQFLVHDQDPDIRCVSQG